MTGPTSVTSDRVKALRRLSVRSHRERTGRFLVEGPQAVAEALTADAVEEVYATASAASQFPGAVVVPDEVLAAMAQTVHPQGVVAVARFVDAPHRPPMRLGVYLHQVRDPGNAGTIIRTADAAGADAVLIGPESVDPYNGKCVRATAGSLFHLPIVREAPLPEGLVLLAADAAGRTTLDDLLDSGELAGPHVWVFGNEARGLPDRVAARCERTVRIPIRGRAESLNLAAAAAVCLYASAYAQTR